MSQYIFIDTETGGLDPDRHAVLQLGAYASPTHTRRSFEILIREPGLAYGTTVTEEAVAINRLTLENLLVNGRSVQDAVHRLRDFVADMNREAGCPPDAKVVFVGHNINFDYRFLLRLQRLSGIALPPHHYHLLDVASVMRGLIDAGLLQIKYPRLDDALAYFNIPPTGRHSAAGDAELVAKVYNACLSLMRPAPVG